MNDAAGVNGRATDEPLRVAVLGAGTIGCFVGGRLATLGDPARLRLTLLGRPRIIDAIAKDGLTIGRAGRRTEKTVLPPSAIDLTTTPDAPGVAEADLLVVTVKAGDTEAAAADVAPHLRPDATVLTLQNGLDAHARLQAALPEHDVLAGLVGHNVIHEPPATFLQTTSGDIVVSDHPALTGLVGLAGSTHLPIRTHADIRAVQHGKFLLNLNNAVNALSGLPLRDELADRDFRRVLAACQEEALAVFTADGVRPARLTPLPPTATIRLLRAPDAVFTSLARTSLRVHPRARSSMADDLALGRPTEIADLQGAVVARGDARGIPTPVCRAVTDLVRRAEAGGPEGFRPWTGAALLAAVLT